MIARRPASRTPIPATKTTIIIESFPGRTRFARKPPTPRYRLIVHTANEQLTGGFQRDECPELNSEPHLIRKREDLGFLRIVALHQEIYATIDNYLER